MELETELQGPEGQVKELNFTQEHQEARTDHPEQGLAGSDLHSKVSLWLKCDNGLEKKGVGGGGPTTEDTVKTTVCKLGPGH